MQRPISLNIDYTVGAGYIRYRVLPAGERVARTVRISDDVNADFNADAEILGIELLAYDDKALGVVRDFAREHDLAVPDHLSSAPKGGLIA